MTDTAVAASEPEVDEVLRFKTVEDMVIYHNPQWLYLINATLDVRPPTEDELATYATRYDDGAWRDLYQPAEPPRIVLPPTAELAALLDPPAPAEEPEPEPLPPPVLDEHAEAHLAKFNQLHDELAAQEQELHHDKHDTQVMDMTDGVSG
jgi:hypothetical protein